MLEGDVGHAVEAALARHEVPGATFGVLVDGEAETRVFGVLDASTGAPVEPESTFRIASITKPFTATLALYLSLSGLLGFDEEVPGPVEEVTVQHLLSHLGGFEGELGDLARYGEDDDALARLVADAYALPALVPPGEIWSYCNAGYWLLAHVLADRLGTPYEDALRTWVLRPLRLDLTGFGTPDASGHAGGEPLPDAYPRARRASGGLVSTAGDLLEFARLHVDDPDTRALREPVVDTPNGWYGFGFALERVGELELWGHSGSYGGFESLLVLEPERRVAFVGLTNAEAGAHALQESLDDVVEAALGVRREPPPTAKVAKAELARVAGRYAHAELELDVRAAEGALELDAVEIDRSTGARTEHVGLRARPLGRRLYAVEGRDWDGSRFDFHPERGVPEFVRIGSRLTPRL